MANPQTENGHTDIANEIMDALARTRIPGEARQVLDFIFRKTYGWHKKEEILSLVQISVGTGLSKQHVNGGIKRLSSMNMITVTENGYGRITENGYGMLKTYAIIKNFELWAPYPKKGIVPEKGYNPYPKTVTPVVKERFKEKIQEALLLNVVAVDEFLVFKSLFIKKWNELSENESQRKPKPGKIPAIMSIAEKTSREKRLKDRWREKNFTGNLDRLFEEIPKSAMLCGRSDKPSPGHENWKITVDWLIGNDKNYLKVLEGNYRDGPGKGKSQMETLMEIAEGKDG